MQKFTKLKNKQIIRDLLEKYKSGTCSEVELKRLLEWMEEDPGLYALLDEKVNQDWKEEALVLNQRSNVQQGKRKSFLVGYWAAAASVLLILAAGLFFWANSQDGMIVYATAYGERKQIELPDGSQVELNANSQLTWNETWKRKGVRSVILEGEAYFDVIKKDGISFQVIADQTIVNVLGTSFNVSNRRGETEVYLNEGKVELEIPTMEKLVMVPGEKVAYQERSNEVVKTEQETLRSAAAWRTGVISFQKVALKDIIPELNDIYGTQLVCRDSSLNEKIMDVGVPYMDWEATKEALELAMKVEIIEIDGTYVFEMKE